MSDPRSADPDPHQHRVWPLLPQGKSTILKTTKSVFDQIRADPTVDLLAAKDQLELYAAARDLEARNRDEYIARASAASDPKVRALFELVWAFVVHVPWRVVWRWWWCEWRGCEGGGVCY